jgi:hypothetical protein
MHYHSVKRYCREFGIDIKKSYKNKNVKTLKNSNLLKYFFAETLTSSHWDQV